MQRYGRGRNLLRRLSLEELFFRGEVLDHEVYTRLEGMEKDKKLKRLLKELAAKEQKHTAIWGKLIGEERAKPIPPKQFVSESLRDWECGVNTTCSQRVHPTIVVAVRQPG
jgi:rubrerythrin